MARVSANTLGARALHAEGAGATAGGPACVNVICDPAAKSETVRFSSYFQQRQP